MRWATLADLLEPTTDPEPFVRESLAALESEHRLVALLALADWARLDRPAPPLFAPVATLQRPSWGSWNGLLLGLREARRDALRDASADERQHIEQAHLLRRLLHVLEQPLASDERERLEPLARTLGLRLPKALRWRELMALPITLRNRIAHDSPTDPAWWATTATHLRPLVALHAESSPVADAVDQAELGDPWQFEANGRVWTFAGVGAHFEARYIDLGGNQRLEADRGIQVLGTLQRMLGKTAVQAKDFRRLLGRLAPDDIKGVLMGDLLVGGPVGRGGFATVHVGRQLSTGRKVAVKILHDGMEEEARERFRREAAYLSRFRNPHIVQVLGYGEEHWSAPKQVSLMEEAWFQEFKRTAPIKTYMALEWIDGETLEEVYRRGSANGPTAVQLATWMDQAAGALATVHGAHLIHRDVKPGNLMVTEDRGVVLMDFGIARSQDEGRTLMTATGTAVGTPAYMSPEQLRAVDADAEVGPPSDVYSLCATFYELFAGERLFHHDTVAADTVRTQKVEGHRPELPGVVARQLPWEIRTILLGGLESDPSDRYASASALQEDVRRFLHNEPITYRRPSLLRRTRLAYRRHRAVVHMVGAFAAIAVTLVVWLQSSAAADRRQDLRRREEAVLAAAGAARHELGPMLAAIEALDAPEAPPLLSPSGEPMQAAVDAWFTAHMAAVDGLEEIVKLADRAPTAAARRRIDPDSARAQHADLSLRAAHRAIDLGQFTLANMWIARAANEGSIDEAARARELESVALARKRRIEADLEKARGILRSAREQDSIAPEFVEQQVIALVRLSSPDLVRLLLEPRYLDSSNELERRIVIGALGRIGDAHTKGPQDLDAVEALCLRLQDVDVARALPVALALASALGDLRDARAHATFDRKRRAAGPSSPFSERSFNAFSRVPLPPASATPGTVDVDVLFERADALADKGRWKEVIAIYDQVLQEDPDSALAFRERARARGMAEDPEGALKDYADALARWPGWADALAGRALVLITLNRFEEARKDAEAAIAKEPGQWLGYFALGSLEAAIGRSEKAEEAFTRVLEIDDRLSQVYMARGLVRQRLGKRAEAESDFKQMKELNPDSPEALLISAQSFIQSGQYQLALADADRAIALDPTRPELYGMRALCWAMLGGAPSKVEEDIRTVQRLAPGHQGAMLLVAQAWMGIRRADLALAVLDDVLSRDPDNSQALMLRGEVHEGGNEEEKALADYTACITTDPGHVDAYVRRAELLARLGRHEQALADAETAARLAPRSLEAKLTRGRIYVRQERWSDALREFSAVLAVDPVHRRALVQRAIARRGAGDHEGSVADLSLALRRKPKDKDALFERATTYLRMGEYAHAEADLNVVIEIDSQEAAAFSNRSVARAQLGRLDEARDDSLQAVRLRPLIAGYQVQLADVCKQMGRIREAIDAYAKALEIDPSHVMALTHRGGLFLVEGNLDAAERDLERALEVDPESAEARNGRGLVRFRRGLQAEALDDFNLGLDARPSPRIRAALLTNRGILRRSMGDPDAALRDFDAAVAAYGEYAQVYFVRGMLHSELGNERLAIADFRMHLKLDPKSGHAAKVRRYLATLGEDR